MAFTIVKSDGTGLSFDVTINEDFNPEIFVTSHPIEDGSTVSDHAQQLPENFSVRSAVTYTPFFNAGNPNLVPQVGPERVEVVLDFLRSIVGQLVIVQTSRGKIIKNCLLTRFSHSFDVRKVVFFDLQFRVIRIATSQVIQIQATRARRSVSAMVASKVDTGSNSLEVCDPETDPKSALDVEDIGKTFSATLFEVLAD